ncbi:MAG: hypothetical protein JWN70_235, partial [Planctomycetaceae bacterium]|nr:hypothetical protein [Planctomycetaceae bacterium]
PNILDDRENCSLGCRRPLPLTVIEYLDDQTVR